VGSCSSVDVCSSEVGDSHLLDPPVPVQSAGSLSGLVGLVCVEYRERDAAPDAVSASECGAAKVLV
jgi:hypothetical protein